MSDEEIRRLSEKIADASGINERDSSATCPCCCYDGLWYWRTREDAVDMVIAMLTKAAAQQAVVIAASGPRATSVAGHHKTSHQLVAMTISAASTG